MRPNRWPVWIAPAMALATGLLACRGKIVGIVKDSEGQAVPGALVAVLPATASREAQLVKSDRDGHFSVQGLTVGSYALTATAPGRVAAYHEPIQIAARAVQHLELQMVGEALTLRGSLVDRTGRPIGNATIRAVRLSRSTGDIFIGKSEVSGAFALTVPKGKYIVMLEAPELGADPKTIEGSGDVYVDFDLRRAFPVDKPPPREVIEWLRANAIPLATPEAGHGFDDLQPLKQVVGDARIVALGEATHGTREFFQLKHRMLEFLATEMGFTVFAIEASYPEALLVNDYIVNGNGDPTDALAAMRFWTWDTEEVLEQIKWMRRYNEDPSHKAKLAFYGFDMQSAPGAVQHALEYLEKVDLAFERKVAPSVAPLDNDFDAQNYVQLPAARMAAVSESLARILKQLDSAKESYLRLSSPGEWAMARMSAKVALQGEEHLRRMSYDFRDRSMAENIKALLDQQPPGARMVVWAHNGHVSKGQYAGVEAMGAHLARMFGAQLVVFGFAFNEGSFRAKQMPFGTALTVFNVSAAPPGSLDASLAAAGKLFAIDIRRAPSDGIVAEWLTSRLRHRQIGAGFSYEAAESFLRDEIPRRSFDALLFVGKTTSARANSSGMRSAPAPGVGKQQKTRSLVNLDFEEAGSDEGPTGWIAYTGGEKASYAVAADKKSFHGKRCASIIRDESPWRWGYGALYQNLDAETYRGKRIRFRAAARSEVSGVGNKGQLFVSVFPATSKGPANALSFASTMDHPVSSADWRFYEVDTLVSAEADSITVGFMLSGNGRAWFDNASLEVMDAADAAH